MSLSVPVIYGSVRHHRKGIRVARFLTNKCIDRGFDTTLIDPLKFKLPLLDNMYKEFDEGNAPEVLEQLADIIKNADGYILCSAEYNHSIPPALSNLLDHFLEEYFFKPSAIACYSAGSFGGVRAAMQLRAMVAEMGMSSIPSIFPVPRVQQSFDEDGTPRDEAYDGRVDRFLNEFEWYAHALKQARNNGTPY